MNVSMTRRAFVTRAARAAALAVAAPSAAPAASAGEVPAAEGTLVLQFCEGVDMEKLETLANGEGVAALEAIAEQHAGAPLSWEEGETEGCLAFALHPNRPAEYLILVLAAA